MLGQASSLDELYASADDTHDSIRASSIVIYERSIKGMAMAYISVARFIRYIIAIMIL